MHEAWIRAHTKPRQSGVQPQPKKLSGSVSERRPSLIRKQIVSFYRKRNSPTEYRCLMSLNFRIGIPICVVDETCSDFIFARS